MKYKHFAIITLVTGIIMLTTMYFLPFEYRKMPIFVGMAIIFTVYFSNKKSIDETNIFSMKNRKKSKQENLK
ncbi:hypothetical protein [Staphylococcus argenteus]|uniref:hypothetical protein n=1 Tax=Staphylococcus argenteus TaxID=985002 RepID=UPI000233FE14|nr:hypothetical protein [Staphylococcus argenteus]API80118.1 hypothetical protein A7971_10830 [Staphylococcus argenteus]MBE2124518.1 hypothetical protein [Staphylococcus argenteus]MBE2130890.1 hypothetical protein [Staphylococcus argenteus]MBE2134595.1 hypothetical protein [Staphylococcus argenteus]MBE2136998.1 hypothetical protein [Staphylococcus argenteus]